MTSDNKTPALQHYLSLYIAYYVMFIILVISILTTSCLAKSPVDAESENALMDQTSDKILPRKINCVDMVASEGIYEFVSTAQQTNAVCALFVAGPSHVTPKLEFLELDVQCENGGWVEFFDGWLVNGEEFPNDTDMHTSYRATTSRYKGTCGRGQRDMIRPSLASQNVAMLQYKVPAVDQGFMVKISFVENRTPCNVLMMKTSGVHTISNHGRYVNCTVTILSAQTVKVLSLDVGVSKAKTRPRFLGESGPASVQFDSNEKRYHSSKCFKSTKSGEDDYLMILSGNSVNTQRLKVISEYCGYSPTKEVFPTALMCKNSAIRLVSSGAYHNSATFSFQPTVADQNSPRMNQVVCSGDSKTD